MSNKTPNVNPAETVSAPNKRIIALLIIIAVLGLGFVYAKSQRGRDNAENSCTAYKLPEKTELQVQERVFEAEIARTDAEKQQGLSGRSCLDNGSAMLFVYDTPGYHCFWMKDMNFPIDMIWLDSEKRVITIEPNVIPGTFPKSFCPTQPAKYVVETEAFVASGQDWMVGTQFEF